MRIKQTIPIIIKTTNQSFYGLRRAAGSISTWNAKLNETVIRDLELTILVCSHCCRVMWSMFDDDSDFDKITLRRMKQMVKSYMGDSGLPAHKHALVEGEQVDVLALWKSLKNVMASMIVEGCELSALDRLRRLVTTQGESDLGLVHRAQMMYQTNEVPLSERECVTILMGKLSSG